MKKIIILYSAFTVIWVAFLILFNEDRISIPIMARVVSLYIWFGITLVCFIAAIVQLRKRSHVKLSYGILLLVLLNTLLMTINPFNIVTHFLG